VAGPGYQSGASHSEGWVIYMYVHVLASPYVGHILASPCYSSLCRVEFPQCGTAHGESARITEPCLQARSWRG